MVLAKRVWTRSKGDEMRYATQPRLYGRPAIDEMSDLAPAVFLASAVWFLILVGAHLGPPQIEAPPGAYQAAVASPVKWTERRSKRVFDERRRRYSETQNR